MQKWYETEGRSQETVVASRVRLLRNLKDYLFPVKLPEEEKKKLTDQLHSQLQGISTVTGLSFHNASFQKFDQNQKEALRERHVINRSAAQKDGAVGLMLSEDESVSLVFNADDHIRLQVSSSGLNLEGAWSRADRIDDFINERFAYGFDQRFGYMTTYPSNLGTGMRAYLILHLPMLAATGRMQTLAGEVGRFGVALKDAYTEDGENLGDLYVAYNQKTLGQSEDDIAAVLTKLGGQIAFQEKKLRRHAAQNHHLERQDAIYKAYGSLKYARILTLKDAMQALSVLRLGACEKLMPMEDFNRLYKLMMDVQPYNLQIHYQKPLKGIELDQARAEYLRENLPEL